MESANGYKLLNFVLGALAVYIAPFKTILILLFLLIVIDTILGMWRAFKWRVFSSRKFKCTYKKLVMYMSAIIVSIVMIHILKQLVDINNLVYIVYWIVGILALSEFFSILENLNDLGLNIPMIRIFTKLKTSIPFMPRYSIDWKKKIYDQTCTILKEEYRPVYDMWLEYSEQIINEATDVKYIIKSEEKQRMLMDAYKVRIKTNLVSQYPDAEDYINELINLYDKYAPIERQNLYELIYAGLLVDTKKYNNNNEFMV